MKRKGDRPQTIAAKKRFGGNARDSVQQEAADDITDVKSALPVVSFFKDVMGISQQSEAAKPVEENKIKRKRGRSKKKGENKDATAAVSDTPPYKNTAESSKQKAADDVADARAALPVALSDTDKTNSQQKATEPIKEDKIKRKRGRSKKKGAKKDDATAAVSDAPPYKNTAESSQQKAADDVADARAALPVALSDTDKTNSQQKATEPIKEDKIKRKRGRSKKKGAKKDAPSDKDGKKDVTTAAVSDAPSDRPATESLQQEASGDVTGAQIASAKSSSDRDALNKEQLLWLVESDTKLY